MAVGERIKSHPDVVGYFKEFPFYNTHIEKQRVKCLKNIDLLSDLLFYEELIVIKSNHAFTVYSMSYKVELVERKDPIEQLEASKPRIKDFFNDLLNETKGFKCKLTIKVVLKKCKSRN